jgi:diaminopimelate epimerase
MTSFTKMHGIGNDFVVLDAEPPSSQWVAAVCDRHKGVGADGVLAVTLVEPNVVRMQYWNADGSVAEMCGNGLRCSARYAADTGLVSVSSFAIETPRGRLGAELLPNGEIRVETGPVSVEESYSLQGVTVTPANVGNPHAVIFVSDVDMAPVDELGSAMQTEFAQGVNVEFVQRTDTGIRVRVWERGVGETLACGSGAVASAVVHSRQQGFSGPVTVELPGGDLTIEADDHTSWITGPAQTSFRGMLSVVDGVVTAS